MKRPAATFLLPVLLAGLAIAGKLQGLAPVEEISLTAVDYFQRLAPRPPSPEPAIVVDIDEKSLAEIGQWPWPRTVLAELTDKLAADGAGIIGFDLIFPEPDRTSPQRILSALEHEGTPAPELVHIVEGLPDHDKVFAEALKRSGAVIGSVPNGERGSEHPGLKRGFAVPGGDPLRDIARFPRVLESLPELDSAAAGVGSLADARDWDGVIRRIPLLVRVGDAPYPSFVAEILRVGMGATSYIVRASSSSGEVNFGARAGLEGLRVGPLFVPTDEAGLLWVAYRPLDRSRWVSAADVLSGRLDAARIRGRIVLIGSSAAGLNDLRATPVGAAIPGVEIHAQALDQIGQGWFLARPGWSAGAELLFIAAMALALAIALPRVGAHWAGFVTLLTLVFAWALSWWAYSSRQILLDAAYPSLVIGVIYASSAVLGYVRSERARRQIKSTFSRLMAPELVEELAAEPERLTLGGETREMTLLFSDIRGFTGISEGLGPQELTAFVNAFLDPMSEVVMRHRGMIDKYIGDCIMALWNAPLPDPNHAANAVAAAKEMRRTLAALNAERERLTAASNRPFKPIRIGIGLNTGDCCVGNMGSHRRMEYSVLGDAVNLASRLESASKTYGIDLILSETTAEKVPDESLVELDLVRVKGKERAVRIFTILNTDGAAPDEVAATLARHRTLRAAYLAQDWDRAIALMDEVERSGSFGIAPLYALYRERIGAFRREPPGSGWDGVHTAHEK